MARSTRARSWAGAVAIASVAAVLVTCATATTAAADTAADADADASYGVDGAAAVAPSTVGSDAAGRLLVLRPPSEPWTTVEVSRLTPDGLPDESYGTEGTAAVALTAAVRAPELLVAPDGSVQIWSTERDGPVGALVGARLDAAGHPVAGFGSGGVARPVCCTTAEALPSTVLVDAAPARDGGARLLVARIERTPITILDRRTFLVSIDAAGSISGQAEIDDDAVTPLQLQAAPGDGVLVLADEGLPLGTRATHVTRWTSDLQADETYGDGGSRVIEGYLSAAGASGNRTWVAVTVASTGMFDLHALDPAGDPVRSFGADGVARWGRLGWLTDRGVTSVVGIVAVPDGGLVVGGRRTRCLRVSLACDEYQYGAVVEQLGADGTVVAPPMVDRYDGELFALVAGAGGTSVLVGRRAPGVPGGQVRRHEVVDHRLAAIAPFASFEQVAQALARDFLDRAATSEEVADLERAFDAGATVSFLVRAAADQPGWADRLEPVVRLYWAYFGRAPDHAGLRYWMGRRGAGVTVARISASFAGSSEFHRRYGALTDRAFVELVYRNVLGRSGDRAGVDFWTRRLSARRVSRGQVMASMSESAEHVRRRSAQVSVVGLYAALLRRAPTAAELADWAGPVPIGDEDALVRRLLASEEYARRL